VTDCPVCGEYMYADEQWQLRAGRAVGKPAEGGDYIHARCADTNSELSENVDGEGTE